jgi:hypothetical protein
MGLKPVMKLEHAIFILSLDISNERTTKQETKKCIDFLLSVLAKYEIPATWAVTGDFLLDPSYKPSNSEHKSRSNDLSCIDTCTDSWDSTLFFEEDILKTIISSEVNHELGYHSFSHPVFPQIRKQIADSEVRTGAEMAEHFGIVLKSFVFPQNKIAHIDVLKKYGLLVYRGETLMQSNLRSHVLNKANGLINEIIAPPVMPEWKNGIWEIPSSMYFADPKHPFSLLPRAKLGLWRAIRSNMVFHVWMHPWNLLQYTSLGRDFKLFMDYVSKKRNEGKIEVRTMGDFANYLNRIWGLENPKVRG